MSVNYSKHVSKKSTPQTKPIFGRTDQVENNAGGYVFKVTDNHILERFILLGTEGGTFYVGEQELTEKNAKTVVNMIKSDGFNVLSKVQELVGRAPKRDPAIFVLALCTSYGNQEVKNKAYTMIKDVCKTSTHLFTFCQNIQDLRGWSRGLRKGVASFYTSKTADQIAYQMVKYRQRNGWTHKDVIKLSHPSTINNNLNTLFAYSIGKTFDNSLFNPLVNAFEAAQKCTETSQVTDLIELIENHGLTWEMVPTSMLNNKEVLLALLEDMPMTALLRNLNRMTKAGLFESNLSSTTKSVVSKLTNVDLIKKAGLHPINILNSMRIYAQGRGDKGSLTWNPNQKIVDALETAFELSFSTVEKTNKNILVAVDISASMSATVNKMSLSAKEVAAALSLTFVKSEPNVDLIWFDTQAYKPKVGARSSYNEVVNNTPNGGGTDCSLAYTYALQALQSYDAIVMLTDNETWAGNTHAVQLFERYKKINPKCKHVVVGMVANEYSVLVDSDPSVLHVAGFDLAIPSLVNNFIR